jgi:CpXC protein
VSFIIPAPATCPTCGAEAQVQFPGSINADRRPDLRAAILDSTLSTQPCRSCGESLTFEPQLTYLDVGRRQWIFAEASDARDEWAAIEEQAAEIFDAAFGDEAPAAAREIGATLASRLVFGWPALAEKLLCNEFGLDDVALEALKLAAIAEGTIPTVYAALDLRLTGREADRLVLQWVYPSDGTPIERLQIPEAAYTLVKGGGEAWAPVAARFQSGMFVDLRRMLHPSVAGQGAA